MGKQLVGVVLLMFGIDYVQMLWKYEGGIAAFGAAQWALAVVTVVMLGLGLYLSITGWKEFNKVLDEREREKKEPQEKFKMEELSGTDRTAYDEEEKDEQQQD